MSRLAFYSQVTCFQCTKTMKITKQHSNLCNVIIPVCYRAVTGFRKGGGGGRVTVTVMGCIRVHARNKFFPLYEDLRGGGGGVQTFKTPPLDLPLDFRVR